MELRHLRYFKTVADEGHITRAAEQLSMQQPPLSLQIKALETELGVQLFHRRPRGVELTEAGRSFYGDACRILEDLDEAVAKTQRVARGEEGNLALGFPGSVIFHPAVKEAIRVFRAEYPKVAMTLEEEASPALRNHLQHNRLDVAFMRIEHLEDTGLRICHRIFEPMYAAIPEEFPLAADAGEPVTLVEVARQPLVLYRRVSGPFIYDRVIAACARTGLVPRIVQEAPRIGAALNLVSAGMGITLVPASLRVTQTDGVVYRPLTRDIELVAPVVLACRKGEASEAVNAFVRIARGCMKASSGT